MGQGSVEAAIPAPPVVSMPALPEVARTHWVIRHWRGELGLGRSYWVNGILLSIAFGLAIYALDWLRPHAAARTRLFDGIVVGPRIGALLSCFGFLALLGATWWQNLGIWRSAGRHVGRGGRRIWVFVVRLLIVIGTLSLIPSIIGWGQILASRWSSDFPLRLVPFAIAVSADGGTLAFHGEITQGAAAAFERELTGRGAEARMLLLSGPGGSVADAIAMAGSIARRRLTTVVDGVCVSACTILYAAGTDRIAGPQARFGFHRLRWSPQTKAAIRFGEAATREVDALYRRAGITTAFRQKIWATPPESVWWPTSSELQQASVVFRWKD